MYSGFGNERVLKAVSCSLMAVFSDVMRRLCKGKVFAYNFV